MASRRKGAAPAEAANPVYLTDYILSAKGPSEMVKRLTAAFDTVVALEQTEHSELPAGLDNIASQAVSDTLMRSKNKEIALLASCVIVEILRLYAPEAPYTEAQLVSIFRAIITQLGHLRKEADAMEDEIALTMHSRAAHVLTSLQTVKSCCILSSELITSPSVRGDTEVLITDLFRTLLSTASNESSRQLLEHAASVIELVLDDIEAVTPGMLQPLLATLVERSETDASYQVAVAVLIKLEARLSVPVAQTVNALLAALPSAADKSATTASGSKRRRRRGADEEDDDDEANDDDRSAAEAGPFAKREPLHRLIHVLASVMPSSMLLILPPLAAHLSSEDMELRTAAITVCGRVFASRAMVSTSGEGGRVCFGRAYPVQFDMWLHRFKDKDAAIRAEMCKIGAEVLREHAELAAAVTAHLLDRLKDANEDVRKSAVIVVCDSAVNQLEHVSLPLLEATAERLQDKSFDVRREAATGLAQAYASHVPGTWQRAAAYAAAQTVEMTATQHAATASAAQRSNKRSRDASTPDSDAAAIAAAFRVPTAGCITAYRPLPADATMLAKLGWIPDRVLPCYDHPETDLRVRIVQLLDCILLPDTLDALPRAVGLLSMYASLGEQARAAFWRIQTHRQMLQKLMLSLLQARSDLRSADLEGDVDARASVHKRLVAAVDAVAASAGRPVASIISLVACVPDNRVYKLLGQLADASLPSAALKAARDDLIARVRGLAANSTTSAAERVSKATALLGSAVGPEAASADMKSVSETVRIICRRMACTSLTQDMTVPLAAHLMYLLACDGDAQPAVESALQLFQEAAALFPSAFTASRGDAEGEEDNRISDVLIGLADAPEPWMQTPALRTLAHLGRSLYNVMRPAVLTALRTLLLNLTTAGDDYRLSKAAMAAACGIFAPAEAGSTDVFFDRFFAAVQLDSLAEGEGASVASQLAAVAALARKQPHILAARDVMSVSSGDADNAISVSVPAGVPHGASGGTVFLSGVTAALISLARSYAVLEDATASAARAKGRKRGSAARSVDDDDNDDTIDEEDAEAGDAAFVKKAKRVMKAAGSKRRRGDAGTLAASIDGFKGIAASDAARMRALAITAIASIAIGANEAAARALDHAARSAALSRAAVYSAAYVHAAVSVLECGGDLHDPRARDEISLVSRTQDVADTTAAASEETPSRKARSGGAASVVAQSGAAVMRLACARGLLRLCAHLPGSQDAKLIGPEQLVLLSRCFTDAHPLVRQHVFGTLSKMCQRQLMPLRCVAMIALGGAEPSPQARRANRDAIAKVCAAFRRFTRAVGSSPPSPAHVLEYALPITLFLLAHDDARFPSHAAAKSFFASRASSKGDASSSVTTAAADAGPFADVAMCIGMLLEGVISSLTDAGAATDSASTAGSVSLMFAILGKIKACEDVVRPMSRAAHDAADLTFLLLKARAKDQRAYAAYPGDVLLPTSMFRAPVPRTAGRGSAATSTPVAVSAHGASRSKAAAPPSASLVRDSVTIAASGEKPRDAPAAANASVSSTASSRSSRGGASSVASAMVSSTVSASSMEDGVSLSTDARPRPARAARAAVPKPPPAAATTKSTVSGKVGRGTAATMGI